MRSLKVLSGVVVKRLLKLFFLTTHKMGLREETVWRCGNKGLLISTLVESEVEDQRGLSVRLH